MGVDSLTSFLLAGVTLKHGRCKLEQHFDDVRAWAPAVSRGGYRHYKVGVSLLVAFSLLATIGLISGWADAAGVTLLFAFYLAVIVPTGLPAFVRWLQVKRQTGLWLLHPVLVLHGEDVSLVSHISPSGLRSVKTFEDAELEIQDGWFLDGRLLRVDTGSGTLELAAPVDGANRLALGLAA